MDIRQKKEYKPIVIRLAEKIITYVPKYNYTIYDCIWEKWGLTPDEYYLPNPVYKDEFGDIIEVQPRVLGGNVMKVIFAGITAVFKPIIKPLIGIAQIFLMLVKGVLYMIMLLIWFIKFLGWFFGEVVPSIPTDIFGMVRFVSFMIVSAVMGTIGHYARKIFNSAGRTVFGAAVSGWDNNAEEGKTYLDSTPLSPDDKPDTTIDEESGCKTRKCYRTEEGSVPWTVVLATVLFPPSGVFMEYGLHGWIQILVCTLLTFMFYFPGLIYALILLYC